MNRISNDDAFEVSDPTDWIETPLPKLSEIDSALRCQVCKDFYATPMTTSCSHTFCSLCIRRSLNNDGKCPACRTPDQELKLRFNGALEDVVEAFKRARPQVLDFAATKITAVESLSPKRKRHESQREDDGGPRKKTRTSGRKTRSSQTEVVVEDSAEEDDDEYIPEDGIVECPICQKRVKEASINSHIDQGCMDRPQPSKSQGRSNKLPITSAPGVLEKPIKRPERLPQLNFQFVKDPALKRKLIDTGLSAGGTRQLLERRYTEWVTLWNANCDATRPKSKVELKRELDIWERTQGRNTVSVQGAQIKDKDFDGKGWSNTHDSDFKDLIAKARAKVALKSQTPSSASTPLPYEATRSSTPNQTTQNEMPSLDQANMKMYENNNNSGGQEASQELPTRLERRFFDENSTSSEGTLSSRYAREVSILKTDASIASDMTTSQTLQP